MQRTVRRRLEEVPDDRGCSSLVLEPSDQPYAARKQCPVPNRSNNIAIWCCGIEVDSDFAKGTCERPVQFERKDRVKDWPGNVAKSSIPRRIGGLSEHQPVCDAFEKRGEARPVLNCRGTEPFIKYRPEIRARSPIRIANFGSGNEQGQRIERPPPASNRAAQQRRTRRADELIDFVWGKTMLEQVKRAFFVFRSQPFEMVYQ
jgi:hypothetical protein